jgi:hypothetical protein
MGRRISRPHEPRSFRGHLKDKYPVAQMWVRLENIYRMWRDFPTLRLGQFLVNALGGVTEGDTQRFQAKLFYISNETLEQDCFRFWLKHSGKANEKTKARWLAEEQ